MTSTHAPLVPHILAPAPLDCFQKAVGGLAANTSSITFTQRSETELRRNRPARTRTVQSAQGTSGENASRIRGLHGNRTVGTVFYGERGPERSSQRRGRTRRLERREKLWLSQ